MNRHLFARFFVRLFFFVAVGLGQAAPANLWACACGCGVFEIGTSAMLQSHPGGMVFLEHDLMNQDANWSGSSRASDDNNNDKQIRTNLFTAGLQYMFNRRWGIRTTVPYWNRYFSMADSDNGITSFSHSAIGDIRASGIYSGFGDDMATGVTFGLKLPSGDFTHPNLDRDTQIGTGSTDALLGAYHVGELAAINSNWNWFTNVQMDWVALIGGGYRPGSEFDAVLGSYYDALRIGEIKVAPLAQAVASHRWRDGGALGHSQDSGYDRLVLAPGVEFDAGPYRVYGDVGFPVYQYVNGNQLVSSQLYKLNLSYTF